MDTEFRSNMIEGFGDDVVYFLLFGLLLSIALTILIIRRCRNYQDYLDGEVDGGDDGDRPDPFNPSMCPICWCRPTFALETNCGHLYCGLCLKTFYELTARPNHTLLLCALCRQNVNLIFWCFSPSERRGNGISGSEYNRTRDSIRRFVRYYNGQLANNVSFLTRIQEVPILLRHFYIAVWNGEEPLTNYLRFRAIWLAFGVVYFFVPFNVFPELIFGMYGFVGDVFLVILTAGYALRLYRNYVVQDGVMVME